MRLSEPYVTKIVYIMMIALCVAVVPVPAFAGSPDTVSEKCKLIKEYTAHLEMIDEELVSLKENFEWLKIKIQQMENYKKPVPKHMTASASYKAERINVLEITRETVSANLVRIDAAYPGSGNCNTIVSDKAFSSPVLDNWFEMMEAKDGRIVFRTKSPVQFSSGSAAIDATYNPMLKDISAIIKSYNPWVVVDGFADKDPIKNKKFPSNFELGAARAANIVHSLVGYGADPSRFKVSSTGEYRFPDERPVSENKDEERYVNITLFLENG